MKQLMSRAVLLALAAMAARAAAPPADNNPSEYDLSTSQVRPLVERYTADRSLLLRSFRLELSEARRTRLRQFYADWRERLAALRFDSLGQDGRIDYLLFRNTLDHELRRLDREAREQEEVAGYTPFAATILALEEARRRGERAEPQASAATLAELARQVDAARKSIEGQARPADAGAEQKRRVAGARAARNVTALGNALRAWFNFSNGYDPLFTWWAEQPYKAVDKAIDGYAAFLRERVAGLRSAGASARAGESDDIIGSPIGRQGLIEELAYEMIPYTPEELIAIGEKEFAWCENEMRRASREMGFGDDWKKALEKVKSTYVEPGRQPALIRELELEAEKFLDDRDLVTIPGLVRESWRMEMMSPQRQLVNPFFTGGEVISVSYPTSSMSHEQKLMSMRGNNIPFARATVFHELIPGHHLQGFMAARFRPYRDAIGGTPFITEGWSLYWELLLWDLHFQKTPEDRVGALFWRMHRAARIIFSLNFHLGKMTPEQAIDFLVDRVGHERENATGEVRRSFGGGYGPLYQAAYLLGGMQLYALRKELVGPGKLTDKQFHDAILRENRIPVEMIRASLEGLPLERASTTSWRFYGAVK